MLPNCKYGRKYCRYVLTNTIVSYRYAYNVWNLVNTAARHWDHKIPVIIGGARYRYSSGNMKCGGWGWNCLLSPLSSCTVRTLPSQHVVVRHRFRVRFFSKLVYICFALSFETSSSHTLHVECTILIMCNLCLLVVSSRSTGCASRLVVTIWRRESATVAAKRVRRNRHLLLFHGSR